MGEQNKLDRLPNVLPWVVGGATLGLVIAYVWTFQRLPSNESPPAWGAFGDYVGGILNPLVSTFTLIVAVKVWQLQKKEMADTRKLVVVQTKTAEQQRREQRFFDLMEIYHQTLSSFQSSDTKLVGKSAILSLLPFKNYSGLFNNKYYPGDLSQIKTTLLNYPISIDFGHYLRVVFLILSDAEHLLAEDHFRYIRLFREQLSQSEVVLLGVHLWDNFEDKEMSAVAKKYGLLKHYPASHFRVQLEKELPSEVFGRSFTSLKQTTQG